MKKNLVILSKKNIEHIINLNGTPYIGSFINVIQPSTVCIDIDT